MIHSTIRKLCSVTVFACFITFTYFPSLFLSRKVSSLQLSVSGGKNNDGSGRGNIGFELWLFVVSQDLCTLLGPLKDNSLHIFIIPQFHTVQFYT